MVGNILVTTRDIKATETILEEHPAALGCKIFFFSSLVPSKQEKNVLCSFAPLVLLNLYIF